MNPPGAEVRLGFGGGCHWCTEAVFQALAGVGHVDQGWLAADPPDDGFSEGVVVSFDPAVISAADLVEVHLHTHASQANHRLREKYRSEVYATDDDQLAEVRVILARLAAGLAKAPVTRALRLRGFKRSRPEIRDYYASDPARPFCRSHIEPKLDLLRRRFGRLL